MKPKFTPNILKNLDPNFTEGKLAHTLKFQANKLVLEAWFCGDIPILQKPF